MSGANCDSGCTSCPTYRGEVRPDSPAMHDMNFARAMQKGAFADRRWGSRAVAQIVRDGIRRRGGKSADDQRMHEFVDGVRREAVAHEAAGPSVGER